MVTGYYSTHCLTFKCSQRRQWNILHFFLLNCPSFWVFWHIALSSANWAAIPTWLPLQNLWSAQPQNWETQLHYCIQTDVWSFWRSLPVTVSVLDCSLISLSLVSVLENLLSLLHTANFHTNHWMVNCCQMLQYYFIQDQICTTADMNKVLLLFPPKSNISCLNAWLLLI
jgi:hypothetical protein